MRLTLEESALDSDHEVAEGGLKFLVNEGDRQFFDKAKLDFVSSFMGGGRFDIIHADDTRYTNESSC